MLFFKHKGLDGPSHKCCFFSTMNIERWRGIWLGRAGSVLIGVLGWILAGCTSGPPVAGPQPASDASAMPANGPRPGAGAAQFGGMITTDRKAAEESPRAQERPGLATRWGEETDAPVSFRNFTRASSKPAGADAIWYNDKKGLEAMDGRTWKVEGAQQAAGGMVEWGVKGRVGWLPAYKSSFWGGKRFVQGSKGGRYKLVVKNRCKSRLEVVLSVDGLDVMDGKSASFRKRGYIVDPDETIEVEGFRTSADAVAAFEFSGVGASYANLKHGDTRNVGVIGLAVFTEKGRDPWTWMPAEVRKRGSARAFAEAP
jgi:hypothetical protein